jgi:hypothetical protein
MMERLFPGWIEEGESSRVCTPAIMRRTATLPGQTRGNLVFGGLGVPGPGVSLALSDYTEPQLMGLLCAGVAELDLMTSAIANAVGRAFDFPEQTWQILELRPKADLGLQWDGKPGDVDLLVGPWREGRPHFDWLAGCEIKRRITRFDGTPASPPSGFGSTQAAGLLTLGCDFSLLLHVLIAEHGEAWDLPSMAEVMRACAMFGPNQERTERAMMKKALESIGPDVGYAVMWWNHEVGHAPAHNASAQLAPYRRPLRSSGSPLASTLNAAVRRLWGRSEFAGARRLRRCPACCDIVPLELRPTSRCPRCGSAWIPTEPAAVASGVEPI